MSLENCNSTECFAPYDDIIHLRHHVSQNHPQMQLRDRAAQFVPFAALTGCEAAGEGPPNGAEPPPLSTNGFSPYPEQLLLILPADRHLFAKILNWNVPLQ